MEDGLKNRPGPGGMPQITIDLFTKDIFVSLAIAVIIFVAGYVIVLKKSVKGRSSESREKGKSSIKFSIPQLVPTPALIPTLLASETPANSHAHRHLRIVQQNK